MIRRSPKTGSAVDQQQEELARRESALRDQMQKLQQMIEDAPRLAQETSRRQREELLQRANQRGSRLDASLSLRDKRWGAGAGSTPRCHCAINAGATKNGAGAGRVRCAKHAGKAGSFSWSW